MEFAVEVNLCLSSDLEKITATFIFDLVEIVFAYAVDLLRKTNRCIPNVFPKGFWLSVNPNHGSNEEKKHDIVLPHVNSLRKELKLSAAFPHC